MWVRAGYPLRHPPGVWASLPWGSDRGHVPAKGFSQGGSRVGDLAQLQEGFSRICCRVSPRRTRGTEPVCNTRVLEHVGIHTPAAVPGSHQHGTHGTQQVPTGARGELELPTARGRSRSRAGTQLVTPWCGFCAGCPAGWRVPAPLLRGHPLVMH